MLNLFEDDGNLGPYPVNKPMNWHALFLKKLLKPVLRPKMRQ